MSKERSARANDATAVQILADPASRRVPIDGGGGVLAIDADGQGVLVVRRLPRAPSGKTYEAWVIPPGGKAKRAGIFTGGEATTIVRLGRPVAPGAMVAATLERAGGVSAPTQSAVFRARA